jgi:signal transduction histidine kinase
MRSATLNILDIGPRLTMIFASLVMLILGGNALLIWQFQVARAHEHRLSAINQQLVAVLRLQESIKSFNEQLADLVQTHDATRLVLEANSLREALLGYTKDTRNSLAQVRSETQVEPALMSILEAIEIVLPSQLDSITALALSEDWGAIHLRLANQMRPLEIQISALVKILDREVSDEVGQAADNMERAQRRILVMVPVTATFTFIVAAFFGWATSRQINELRAEERIAERTRIARELHDTLLQGFIAASMQLDVATDQLPRDSPAKPTFERVLQLVSRVIEDGRQAVRGFRSDRDLLDLKEAFSRVQQEFESPKQVDFRILESGRPHSIDPLIRDEIYSIGREALVNAFRHSCAKRVEVEIVYSRTQLEVMVRDDGCGMDFEMLTSGRKGHWGLLGMRERADKIDANFKVFSRIGSGTEVILSIPGRIAFRSSNRGS